MDRESCLVGWVEGVRRQCLNVVVNNKTGPLFVEFS